MQLMVIESPIGKSPCIRMRLVEMEAVGFLSFSINGCCSFTCDLWLQVWKVILTK